jgi:predicted  nucleic acid-binding Zn-ribbon protein
MRAGELLLHHQRQDERVRQLQSELHELARRLEGDPEVERLESELEASRRRLEDAKLSLRDMDRTVTGHRERTRAREVELMSGRIRNPTELMQLSHEVELAKAQMRDEEDRELELMATVEDAERQLGRLSEELQTVREAWEARRPVARHRIEAARSELNAAERERDGAWAQVPPDYQAAYRRLQPRIPNPVAEVAGGQCGACRVALTASELQQVRRGEQLLHCQNCNRLLVAV